MVTEVCKTVILGCVEEATGVTLDSNAERWCSGWIKMQPNRGTRSPGGFVAAGGEFSRGGLVQDTFSSVC